VKTENKESDKDDSDVSDAGAYIKMMVIPF
jgi:hypothetical protein